MRVPLVRKICYAAEDLRGYMIRVLAKAGASEEDAAIVADVLLAADLRGVESHGIIRLFSYYAHRLRAGLIHPNAQLSVISESTGMVAFDAGNGLGHPAAYRAMQRCIEKARQAGVGVATVRNSNHYGIAGYYAMMALPHEMIGLSFTNAASLVAPTYGRTAVLGTNPIAVAAPGRQERPYVLDMATSIVPSGKISVYERAGLEVPPGWLINNRGEVTTQPSDLFHGGALMPLGGTDQMRGYKGYGLGLMVEILCGVLAGAAFGRQVDPKPNQALSKIGHCLVAVDISAFRPVDEFKGDLDALMRMLKEAPKAAGQDRIYIHGEKEFERAEKCLREGVPILAGVARALELDGQEFGIPFDLQPCGEIEEAES